MATFEDNRKGESVEVSVTVENDDGRICLFLSDNQDLTAGLDLFTDDPDEIEFFFKEIAKAKDEYDRLKQAGRT